MTTENTTQENEEMTPEQMAMAKDVARAATLANRPATLKEMRSQAEAGARQAAEMRRTPQG